MTLALPDVYGALEHFFWPGLRMLALFSAAPLFTEKQAGKKNKIALAALITFLIAPELPASQIPLFSLEGVWVGAKQLIIGTGIGLAMQFAFAAVRMAGEIAGLQMGLSFASFFDPSAGQSAPVLSRLFNLLAMLLFLTFNGHLWLIALLVHSFEILPISDAPLCRDGFLTLVQSAGMIFSAGLQLGMPLITLLLAINLTLGLLNRLTPQLSVFVIGFPLTLSVGMLSLSMVMYTLTPFFAQITRHMFDRITQILIMFS